MIPDDAIASKLRTKLGAFAHDAAADDALAPVPHRLQVEGEEGERLLNLRSRDLGEQLAGLVTQRDQGEP